MTRKKSTKKPEEKSSTKPAEKKSAKKPVEEKSTAKPATDTQGEETATKGEDKGTTEAPEVQKVERPAEACEVWGENDPNSRICKSCPVETECKKYTAQLNAAKPKKTTSRKRPAHDGNFTQFGHCKATSQAGLIELALDKPTTIEELMEAAGATKSRVVAHLGFLNKKDTCVKVLDEDGKFHYELVKEETEEKKDDSPAA